MLRRHGWWVLILALLAAWSWWRVPAPSPASVPPPVHAPQSPAPDARTAPALPSARTSRPAHDTSLPQEAHDTLALIHAGGPFRYRQDGSVFQNRERRLPARDRGYYREYTVETPRSRDRGARRIVTGGRPPREFWYTDDHYRSFRQIDAAGRAP